MDIETIYRLYFRDVCLFLQGLTRSEALAEELTQETFFRALDGLKDYDGKQDVRAWLFTVARNAYYDHCRRAKHAAPLEDAETKAADSPDIAQLLVDKDAAFTVHQCLHALEEPYKEVFSGTGGLNGEKTCKWRRQHSQTCRRALEPKSVKKSI